MFVYRIDVGIAGLTALIPAQDLICEISDAGESTVSLVNDFSRAADVSNEHGVPGDEFFDAAAAFPIPTASGVRYGFAFSSGKTSLVISPLELPHLVKPCAKQPKKMADAI